METPGQLIKRIWQDMEARFLDERPTIDAYIRYCYDHFGEDLIALSNRTQRAWLQQALARLLKQAAGGDATADDAQAATGQGVLPGFPLRTRYTVATGDTVTYVACDAMMWADWQAHEAILAKNREYTDRQLTDHREKSDVLAPYLRDRGMALGEALAALFDEQRRSA